MTKREKIVSEALTWVSTPYHHAARVKGGGTDCAMILIEVYSAVGLIENFEPKYYPMDWALHRGEERYLENVLKYAEETDTPKIGDIIVYKFGRCISHAGIYIGDGHIVHAWMRSGNVTISRIDEGELADRIAGYYTVFKKGN
jgi:cell wall-associated NlpC family hydrolase